MKILLVAYEFPPILAAQALRWFYLSNELAKLGVNVHVICPDISAEHAFPMDLDGRIVEIFLTSERSPFLLGSS